MLVGPKLHVSLTVSTRTYHSKSIEVITNQAIFTELDV